MTTVTIEDLHAREADILIQLGELADRRRGLAPEVAAGGGSAAEIAEIEGEIAELEREIERVHLAQHELERRGEEEAAASAAERRQALIARVREISDRRAAAAVAVDDALAALAAAVSEHHDAVQAQERAFRALRLPWSGVRSFATDLGALRGHYKAAVKHAFHAADAPPWAFREMRQGGGLPRSLAAADFVLPDDEDWLTWD